MKDVDLQRTYELIYGKKLLNENNQIVDKIKNTVGKIFGKKEETPVSQGPRIVRATSDTSPSDAIKSSLSNVNIPTPDVIKNPLDNIKPPTPQPKGPISFAKGFTQLDLSNHKDYKVYSQISQAFINKRNPNAGISGDMMASAAANVYRSTKKYIPPELALAQLALEGGLSKDPKAKPIRTNNPFNVGHYDHGRSVPFRTKQEGINRYYELIANNYLSGGKTAAHLAQNFTNVHGNRYASAPDYESKLKQIMREVNNISQSITSTYT